MRHRIALVCWLLLAALLTSLATGSALAAVVVLYRALASDAYRCSDGAGAVLLARFVRCDTPA